MSNNSTAEICALSQASFNNLVVSMNKISELATEIASMAYNNNLMTKECAAAILFIASAAEKGGGLLGQCLGVDTDGKPPVSHLSDEQGDLVRRLKNVLIGISEGAQLVALLELGSAEPAFSRKLALCRQNLALHGAMLRKLFAEMICYELAEGGGAALPQEGLSGQRADLRSLRAGCPHQRSPVGVSKG